MTGGLNDLILYCEWITKTNKYRPEKIIKKIKSTDIYKLDEPNIFSDSETICLFFDIKFNNEPIMNEKKFYLNNANSFFNCSSNNIENINLHKNGLIKINCSHNKINTLDELPDQLVCLDCDRNKLKEINIQSNKLIWLNCSSNNIINLNNLPTSLKYLMCGDNSITQLDYLPESLKYLDCSHNNKFRRGNVGLIKFDNLPNSLIYFICMDNNITQCYNLPKSLKIVSLYLNCLYDIQNLPIGIKYIDLEKNNFDDKDIVKKQIEDTNNKIEVYT